MAHQRDSDLFLGLLAVWREWLSAEQLRAALRECEAGGQPLSEVLLAQNLASTAACAELAEELRDLLERCDYDGERVRRELARAPQVAAALQLLAGGDSTGAYQGETSSDPGSIAGAAVPPPPVSAMRASVRYRTVRPHARGGLGEVARGYDEELQREVALKRIRAEHAHDSGSQLRFLREAEITAALQHPGIVPVYSRGLYEDGTPFYAMRFIEGESLKAAIQRHYRDVPAAERALDLRRLLGRFVTACQAVAYAHSRGVLHRDLKPSNIMLGEFGETLVVDWGLAKRSAEPPETTSTPLSATPSWETQANLVLGTLQYASPEQASGQLDHLGPASDVYSLGATLYEILTGRPPFDAPNKNDGPGPVIQQICEGKFPEPSAVRSEVARPLNAICCRAMATKPVGRYASVTELAADVERFLADEPVAAHRETRAEVLRRWLRKHSALVASAAVVLLLAGAGLGAFSVILSDKNQTLFDLTGSLNQRNGDLRRALERESAAHKLASANAAVARRHGATALATLQAVVSNLQAELRDAPGGSALRQQLLAASLEQLQTMSDEFVSEVALDETACSALVELGVSILQFGCDRLPLSALAMSSPTEPLSAEETTALQIARTLFERAVDLAGQLRVEQPDAPEPRHDMVVAWICLGAIDELQGDSAAAEDEYALALLTCEALAAESPKNPFVLRDQAIVQGRLGDVHRQTQGLASAQVLYEQSLAAFRKLTAAAPLDVQSRRDLAAGLGRMGELCVQLGRMEEARTLREEQLELCAELAAEDPHSAQARRVLAQAREDMAQACQLVGDLPAAEELLHAANELWIEQLGTDPSDWRAQFALAVVIRKQGQLQAELGRSDRAAAAWQEAAERCARIAAAEPQFVDAQHEQALLQDLLGDQALAAGDFAAAQACFEQAQETRARLSAADPTNRLSQWNLSISLDHLADAALAQADYATAGELLARSLALKHELTAAEPLDRSWQKSLAVTLERLGEALQSAGDLQAALRQYQEAYELRTTLAKEASDAYAARLELAVACEYVAGAWLALGDLDSATPYLEQALNLARELVAAYPDVASLRRKAVLFEREAAQARFQREDFSGAADAYSHAAALLRSLPAELLDGQAAAELVRLEDAAQFAARVPMALGDWQALLAHDPEEVPALLEIRGLLCVERGRHEEAAEAAAQLCESDRATATQLYNAACVLARCAAADEAQATALVADALHALNLCVARGFADREQLLRDPDLAILRDLPEFQALLATLPGVDAPETAPQESPDSP